MKMSQDLKIPNQLENLHEKRITEHDLKGSLQAKGNITTSNANTKVQKN